MTKALPDTFTIQEDFPSTGYEQWRTMVEETLQGAPFEKKLVAHTYDGIDIQPIYCRNKESSDGDAIGYPGFSPFVRDSQPLGAVLDGWDLRQEHAQPDLQATKEAIMADLNGGVTSIQLRLDAAACCGFDPDQEGASAVTSDEGLMAYSVEDLETVLADVPLNSIGIALDAGAASLPAAAMLAAVWQRRGVSAKDARGAFNADPLAFLARTGRLPLSTSAALGSLADLANWTAANYPQVTAVGVDTSPYHDAGATASQDIAFAAATAVEYLRAMTDRGMTIDAAAGQILFRMGLGTHHFLAIAKLRAARWVWARVVEACGGSREAQAMKIHARTSNRVLTQHDPYVNLLRNSVAVFAAGVGGADAITSVPFDAMIRLPDEFSRRVARNSVLVLQDEAHLHRVIDPAGGSWFLDQLTEDVAEKAWEIFQETERQGGMLAALKSNWVAQQIDEAYLPRAKDIARRKEGITGVSEFPDANEERVSASPPDIPALRKAAATRVSAARQTPGSLQALTSADDQTAGAVTAAREGATLGQISGSLGFQTGEDFQKGPAESIAAWNHATLPNPLNSCVTHATTGRRHTASDHASSWPTLAPSPITPHARAGRKTSSRPVASK